MLPGFFLGLIRALIQSVLLLNMFTVRFVIVHQADFLIHRECFLLLFY